MAQVPAVQALDHLGQNPPPTLVDGSLLHRLRCVDMGGSTTNDRPQWFGRECTWPNNLFVDVNGNECAYPGRTRPIDTTYFMIEGQNRCRVIYGFAAATPDATTLAVAIEAIRIVSHDKIMNNTKRRPATEVIDEIKNLFVNQASEDDDVLVVSSKRTVSLIEPYSGSTACNIPVRTLTCNHLECFDLETHLSQQKCEQPGDPTFVDGWRCPICRTDARPTVLFKDGYMLQVRRELERGEHADARSITIESNGSWRPVVQTLPTALASSDDTTTNVNNGRKRKIVEVIELD